MLRQSIGGASRVLRFFEGHIRDHLSECRQLCFLTGILYRVVHVQPEGRPRQPRGPSRLNSARAVDGTGAFIFTGNRLRYDVVVTVWQGWS
jgi:hypothetical protein